MRASARLLLSILLNTLLVTVESQSFITLMARYQIGKVDVVLPRTALVIGVEGYDREQIAPLRTPVSGARAVEALLSDHGFQVDTAINPTRAQLVTRLAVFRRRIEQLQTESGGRGCIALLYFAGHGLYHAGSPALPEGGHFMLPADWRVEGGDVETALVIYGCPVEGPAGALASMQSAHAGIAVFDACRSVATGGQQLLLRGGDAGGEGGEQQKQRGWGGPVSVGLEGSNLLVCYACAPRGTAADGIGHGTFTNCVLKASSRLPGCLHLWLAF